MSVSRPARHKCHKRGLCCVSKSKEGDHKWILFTFYFRLFTCFTYLKSLNDNKFLETKRIFLYLGRILLLLATNDSSSNETRIPFDKTRLLHVVIMIYTSVGLHYWISFICMYMLSYTATIKCIMDSGLVIVLTSSLIL